MMFYFGQSVLISLNIEIVLLACTIFHFIGKWLFEVRRKISNRYKAL